MAIEKAAQRGGGEPPGVEEATPARPAPIYTQRYF